MTKEKDGITERNISSVNTEISDDLYEMNDSRFAAERFKRFTALTAKIRRSIQKIKVEEMSEFSLKGSHVSCLYYIYNDGPLTATELCEICDEDKALVSRSLEYLEKEGFLECHQTNGKKYRAVISLTEKGKKVGKQLEERIAELLNIASSGLSVDERFVMYKCLDTITSNLQKICDHYN